MSKNEQTPPMTEQTTTVPEEKKESKVVRFFVTLIWFIISIGIDIFAVLSKGYIIGAAAEFVFFIITMCVPYLRRKGTTTRWLGYFALAQAVWLIALMFLAGGE